ncbi:hypothetical protein L873DRAFT_1402686 [Choiromyces venosus 120613-1]|uniref:Uncharacterized protein n=1 Tax=Choiromyces venosus 120613-1 TaxID=1336337 RepID=A0A3N4JDC5_9PEZI|nr:hypothetical protein L873DRAFT_1402686 [Choiromyces venosus 120613-1]
MPAQPQAMLPKINKNGALTLFPCFALHALLIYCIPNFCFLVFGFLILKPRYLVVLLTLVIYLQVHTHISTTS